MRSIGLALLCVAGVAFFPWAMIYLGVRVGRLGRLGDPKSARIKLAGPSVADLQQRAEERFAASWTRPLLATVAVCVVVGGLLVLLGG